jgi:hypothetical protein
LLHWKRVPNAGPLPQDNGTDRLNPGQTTPVHEIINVDGKGASVSLHANGLEGGCNTGSLMSWSGELVHRAAAASVRTLPHMVTAALVAEPRSV